ncbi:MAG: S1C family serine protease, partial [Ruminococcus sp.]
ATFGDSDQIEITEDVIAIGNPRGLDYQNSVTKGIVSAVDRVASSNNSSKFIQIDAAINPGNSGGPLCNMYGQVIGITTSKIALDDYEGMGFAIPSKTVKKIVDDIIRYSYVQNRVKIGITGTAVISQEYDIKGIEIVSIEKDSPLNDTKAKEGDIIIGLGGTEVTTFTEVYNVLEEYRSGDKIQVKLFRPSDESEFTVKITLEADK